MKLRIIIVMLVSSVFVACNNFLDEPTSKNSALRPTGADQLEALLNNYYNFMSEEDRISIFAADDYNLSVDIYRAKNTQYVINTVQYSLWDNDAIQDYNRPFWSSEWKKIFVANMILFNLPKVTGTTELKEQLKNESHFIRAYSYFKLVEAYCLPYTETTKNEMGLPIKQSVSFDESSVRATLEETHTLIEADLTEALKITNKMEIMSDKNRSWRASKGAVNAFVARYWLMRGDYNKALSYANVALAEHSTLMDYNVDMRFSEIESIVKDSEKVEYKLLYPYTHDERSNPKDILGWKEFYYLRLTNNASWWNIPSQELMNLYDHTDDLRYKYHYVQHFSFDRGLLNYDYPGYVFFYKDQCPSGPTVAEMLLTKAECQIRNGQWQDGIQTVNILRRARIANTSENINLTAASPTEALKKILEERRRELPFSIRWADIRRFNHNSDPSDNVVLEKTFYPYSNSAILGTEPVKTYKLDNGSRRYASPIPRVDIDATQGVLKQNIY